MYMFNRNCPLCCIVAIRNGCTSHPQINPLATARGQFAAPVQAAATASMRTCSSTLSTRRSLPTQYTRCVPIKVIAWIIAEDLTQFILSAYSESGEVYTLEAVVKLYFGAKAVV